jgi:ribosomal protein S18 acetylase RimI-like enzyme
MTEITIERARDGDLAEILRNFERFWGDREFPRYLHHPMFSERGATALKAITSPENEGSIAFHRRMGFTEMTLAQDYAGSGRARVVMRRPLARAEP